MHYEYVKTLDKLGVLLAVSATPVKSPDDPFGARIWSQNFAPLFQTYIKAFLHP